MLNTTQCLALLLGLIALALPAFAGDNPEREPGTKATGKVFTWSAKNGTRYEYFVPKDYDSEKGANLTLILHGSNLDRRWGFANHKAGEFREYDIVVCPDGTTPNGNGGFNSMQSKAELERFNELHLELMELFKVKSTFLYGHSQGSFFAFYYAGAYPDLVQGLVGQASGVWIGTGASKKHHHQAVCLMHGTADPVVGYGRSVGGHKFYSDANYPLLHLRSLEGWNHWPAQAQTEMQLAWCEAMTSSDPERLAICLETIDGFKDRVDASILYQVAQRVASFKGMPTKVVVKANKAIKAVDKAALAHVNAINRSLGKGKGTQLADNSWVGHIPRFLRHYQGVPAAMDLERKWRKRLDENADQADKHSSAYWSSSKKGKTVDAFEDGIQLLDTGFFSRYAENEKRLVQLETWFDEAKKWKFKKNLLKDYKKTVPVFRSAIEKGKKEFKKQNGKRFG
jgi:hypothetical protein